MRGHAQQCPTLLPTAEWIENCEACISRYFSGHSEYYLAIVPYCICFIEFFIHCGCYTCSRKYNPHSPFALHTCLIAVTCLLIQQFMSPNNNYMRIMLSGIGLKVPLWRAIRVSWEIGHTSQHRTSSRILQPGALADVQLSRAWDLGN